MESTSRIESKEPQNGGQEEEHDFHAFKQLIREKLKCRWKYSLHYNVKGGEPKYLPSIKIEGDD